jgi:hypothetical protein
LSLLTGADAVAAAMVSFLRRCWELRRMERWRSTKSFLKMRGTRCGEGWLARE